MIASLAITIFSRQPRPGSNKQVTFYLDEVTFHSHDHQTDNLLKESRHDNNRQITIVSLATTNNVLNAIDPLMQSTQLGIDLYTKGLQLVRESIDLLNGFWRNGDRYTGHCTLG